ncbi:ABC transporter permease [Desulfotomaculum nigrificans]|uniref:ABC transporter permease n=1 Tax=Desulfotomaculum nigrificans TaxID=1565 RepID=UPI0001FAE820|nr:ABC transporter permease subunit [Desulfotomaculum nigrificans]
MYKKQKFFLLLGLLPFTLLLILFEILPILSIAHDSFIDPDNGNYTLDLYREIFHNKFYLQSLRNSLYISLLSSLAGILIAILGAYSLSKLSVKSRERVLMLSNMTSNFAGVPLAFAFMILLGNNGLFTLLLQRCGLDVFHHFNLYSAAGLTVVYIYFQIPLGILLLYPSYDGIKEEWKEAASILGASKFSFWRYVGIPVLLPGILGTFSILFANAMGAYATAYALTNGNYNLIPIRIGALISGDMFLNPNMASALAVILGLMLISLTLINEILFKQKKGLNHE